MLRVCWRLSSAGAAVAVFCVGALAHEAPATAPSGSPPFALAKHPSLAMIKPAPDFTLLDSEGQPVALSQNRGRVVLLSFIYTNCATTCPLLTQRMVLLKDRLKDAALWPDAVSFLSVTVDPGRDTAAAMANFAHRFDASDPNWHFLRDQPDRMGPVLAAYNEWTKPLPDGELDHPARVYLIDQRGNIREIYALAFFDERQAFADIQTLAEEGAAGR
jgi:protein SCO1